jgi:hypothetical protein
MPQVGVRPRPEFPFQFGKHVASVGKGRAAAKVDRAANVVWMGVSEDDGIDILRPYTSHFQARLNSAGRPRVFPRPGIDQRDMASRFDQQTRIRAEDRVLRQMMACQFAV